MPITFIPFDGWSPSGSYFGEGWSTAMNLFPAYGDWRPWRKFVSLTPTVADGPMAGRHVHFWTSGIGTAGYAPDFYTVFCGSPTKLYEVSPFTGSFTDISRGGGYTADYAAMRFFSVGNDIWAFNWKDAMQRRTNNTGNFANGVVSTFKPVPRFGTTVREHAVVANLNQAGHFFDEVVWSDADDATNFDPAPGGSTSTSLAAGKRLVSIPGQITGLVGGQYLLVFKRDAIYYGEYVGYPTIFNFDVLSPSIGTAFPSSIINSRYGTFFLGPDGFYQIQGLSAPQKISPPGVDRFLTFSGLGIGSGLYQVPAIVAWQEDTQVTGFKFGPAPLIGWTFRFDWSIYGNEYAILYNPVTQQWAQVQVASTTDTGVQKLASVLDIANGNDQLAAITWDESVSRYAPLDWESFGALSNVWAPELVLNFRPATFDSGPTQGQSQMKGVMPIFSKWAVSDAALTPTVKVEGMLDPANNVYGTPEIRPASERDPIAGWYPFQTAGRLFRVSIPCAAEDFASFEGVWVNVEALR